jgi:hypothetical protein
MSGNEKVSDAMRALKCCDDCVTDGFVGELEVGCPVFNLVKAS